MRNPLPSIGIHGQPPRPLWVTANCVSVLRRATKSWLFYFENLVKPNKSLITCPPHSQLRWGSGDRFSPHEQTEQQHHHNDASQFLHRRVVESSSRGDAIKYVIS